MERPLLRPLDAYPVHRNGKMLLKLKDSSRLTDFEAMLPPEVAAVVDLFDGERTRDDICKEFQARYRQPLPRPALDNLIEQLDGAMLLDSERFRQYSAGVFAEFARAPVRMPLFAGATYPNKAAELTKQLDAHFDPPNGPGRPTSATGARPKAIIASHLDFARAGAAYAWAYRPVADAADAVPDLVVIFGSDHGGFEQPFTLTRKDFETPLGRLSTDVDLVDRLARETAPEGAQENDDLFSEEHHHRGEHAIEFHAVWLKHVYGARTEKMKILPILCGSLNDFFGGDRDPAAASSVGGFLGKLAAAVEGRKVLWIASADLAHVGPQYNDREPLTEADRRSLEKRDGETLAHVLKGDAAGWWNELRKERDRRRVCGLAPIYALLTAAKPGDGRLAVYAQAPGEEGSVVSLATIVWD